MFDETPEKGEQLLENKVLAQELLNLLTDEEKSVVILMLGLYGENADGETFRSAAELLEIDKETVRRIYNRALEKVRNIVQ